MSFGISQKTLERLEWGRLLERLSGHARTPRARARIAAPGPDGIPGGTLFAESAEAMRARLDETGEALAVLASAGPPPLSGLTELGPALERAGKGGALEPQELLAVGTALLALQETGRHLGRCSDAAPGLSARADALAPQPDLRAAIERCLEPSGELRDEASPALAAARRDARRLAGQVQERIERMLREPGVRGALSDAYFTVRGDRYVLPVRADARQSVRGIVHDASRTGTTLFVEPEALVELNNQHKQAELSVLQETRRVLRELSQGVAEASEEIEAGLAALEQIDLAFARAELARAQQAVAPEVGDAGVVHLPQLRHPLIPPDEVVANDLRLGEAFRVLLLSGPNAGGKTVAMKAVALAVLQVRAGLFVPATAPARVDVFDAVLADIGDEQDLREHLSTFSAHMANLAQIVERAGPRTLVVLDEVGVGTDPGEGAALGQAVLEALADAGARVIATTHYNLLKEMAEVDPLCANASVEFDPETLAPTYRIRMDLPGASSAAAVAARMGLPRRVLERADELLSREDRRLDRMLAELADSRATLEREKREAERLREESETARQEYVGRLERLRDRRDALYQEMRRDLDRAFREAHGRVAEVVRELQRGPSSREAARAREELLALEESARAAESEAGVTAPRPGPALDWSRARPGDPVTLEGGTPAVLVALPDPRGRVAVRRGSVRLVLAMERVGAARPGDGAGAGAPRPAAARPGPPPLPAPEGGAARCDLRGLRVEEALDQLGRALDEAAGDGRECLVVVHGVGTGALRRAVREELARSPYVSRTASGSPERDGDGATTAYLGD